MSENGTRVLDRSEKVCFAGTHRVCTPDETLRRIEPLLDQVGVTRLADITWLDDIGIPVYQAVRPDGYTVSVAQGKGLAPELAKISAAMEAIETWHAERIEPPECRAEVGEVEGGLGYHVDELSLAPRHHLNPALRLDWSRARHLVSGMDTLVPTRSLRLDGRVSANWEPRLFETTSNGLGSGNTFQEAALHGMYEVIERDTLVRYSAESGRRFLDTATVDGIAGQLIDRFAAAGVHVSVEVMLGPLRLPCFRATITSDMFPAVFAGLGCHLDREVSLCRALTEAAQSRLTSISGVRDDMSAEGYRRAQAVATGHYQAPDVAQQTDGTNLVRFQEVESVRNRHLDDDLRLVGARILEHTGRDPIVVEHTRPELRIPVVRVICPKMLHDVELV